MIETNFNITTNRLSLVLIDSIYKDDIFREFTLEVAKFMIPQPTGDINHTISFINESLQKTLAGIELQLVAVNKDTNEFLGCVGLHHIDTKTPVLGLWFKKSAWGQGYGKESMLALKEWADENLAYEKILYPVFKENIPSRKIAEFLGGKVVREFIGKNQNGQENEEVEYVIERN